MVDPWPNYVSMVSGLSKATRAKAVAAARSVLAQAGLDDVAADAGERISKLAEEIIVASRANRELLENLVTAEVDKAATRLGFVRAEDLSEIRAELAALKAQLIVLTAPASDPAARTSVKGSPTPKSPAPKSPAQKSPATKTPAKKTPAKKTPAKRAPAKKSAASPATSGAASSEADT